MGVGNWLTRGAAVAAVVGFVAAGLPAATAAPAIAGAGGGYGADFTGDGLPDILARDGNTGALKVYPHSGAVNGTATFTAPVTINLGWQNMRWIGARDLTNDGLAEVIAIDQNWQLVVAVHSGQFDGTNTLEPGLQVVGYDWNVNDLVSVTTGGLLARRADTGEIFAYYLSGKLDGTNTFQPPRKPNTPQLEPHDTDVFMTSGLLGAENGAFMFVGQTGELYAWNTYPMPNQRMTFGYGWHTLDSYVLTDLNGDHYEDLLARDPNTGDLYAYLHSGRDPWRFGSPYTTRLLVGTGWQANDIIT
jgi:VCBS repeat protein